MYLFINTINNKFPSFVVFDKKGKILKSKKFIDKIENLVKGLNEVKINYKDVRGVLAISGPGSFTSSRAGIVLANSFNFIYKIPVLGVKDRDVNLAEFINKNLNKLKKSKKVSLAKIHYKCEPNITIKQ